MPHIVVHCPELFEGDRLLDLVSPDKKVADWSMKQLKNVVRYAEKILREANCQKKGLLITNVGGHSDRDFLPNEKKIEIVRNFIDISEKLKNISSNIEIIPQSMPPFPWHFGGQRFHNLFVHYHK